MSTTDCGLLPFGQNVIRWRARKPGNARQPATVDILAHLTRLPIAVTGRAEAIPKPSTPPRSRLGSGVQGVVQIESRFVVVGSNRVLCVADEDQWQVVRITSTEQVRGSVSDVPSVGEEVAASQERFNSVELAEGSDIERHGPQAKRLRSMTTLMTPPRFSQDQDDGTRGWVPKYSDGVVASDHCKGTELAVERHRSFEVADGDQCGPESPRLYGVVGGHGGCLHGDPEVLVRRGDPLCTG